MSSSTFFHKPELALRRALELEGINQPEASLELLHEVLSSRRHRTWSPTHEQIMITYLNLCLKLHKSREAKDGLHQYRNLSQSLAPGSLEKVIRYLMEKAELQCSEAKASVDKQQQQQAASSTTTSTSLVSDPTVVVVPGDDDVVLSTHHADGEEEDAFGASPQAILLSTMSTDPAKTQRDTTLLLPSLKFLWETYRAILDILKSNSKLEHVYHAAAMGALRFCRTYKRRTEFRRLCDLLRMHLGNLQKYGNQLIPEDASKPGNSKVRGWEGWTTDAIELHLQTRFMQLETASVLHLHTEGFRTVEDIYNILQISHARTKMNPDIPPPKAKLMAAYYEKLTTLFWVSENYLFHAFAWYKYYTLCKEYNRGMSEDMKRMQVSAVLLAALCIPNLPNGGAASTSKSSSGLASSQAGISTSSLDDDIVKEKMARMATLLGFHTRNPTREALLTEIRSKNILELAPPYLRELYVVLEENSDPLIMVERARPLLEQLKQEVGATNANPVSTSEASDEAFLHDDHDGAAEDNTLGRYVKPLTSVLLLKLVLNLSAAYHTVSMDHLKKLTNGLDVTFEQVEKAIVLFTQTKTLTVRIDHRAGCLRFGDAQLESDAMRSQLTVLSKQLDAVCRILQPPDQTKTLEQRRQLFLDVSSNLRAEHAAALERKNIIEQRKEEAERLAQEKVREELRIKAEEEAARKVEEEQRIAREQKMREHEKQLKIQRELESMEKKKYLEAMGHKTDALTEEEMAKIDTAALQKEHQDKVNKERDAIERKKREASKQLDYLVRAVRIEELPSIKKRYEEKIRKDRERYEAEVIEKVSSAKLQWQADVEAKEKLQVHNVFSYMAEFESLVMRGRRALHEEACREADRVAELEAEKGKLKRARRRKLDEQQRLAEEEARRKAEEEKRKEEEELRRREEARREKEAKEEERRLAELARMQEERDRKEKEKMQSIRPPPPSRDLEAVAPTPSTSFSSAAASGGSKYVPPSLRNRAAPSGGGSSGGGGGGDSRNRFDRGGYPGGGRYEGRSEGRSNDRSWGSGDRRDDRRGGFDDRRGGGGSDDRRAGGAGGGDDRRGGGTGGGGGGGDDRRAGGTGGGGDERRGGGGGFGGGDRRYGDRDGARREDRDRNRDGPSQGGNTRWR